MSNTLVVGLFAGCMVGFILSMLAGAFGVGTIQNVPDWLQGVFSGFATFVSIYAVYLVSETLRATRDTLAVTQQMADAQTRPWVLYESEVLASNANPLIFDIKLRNYGLSPAVSVRVSPEILIERFHLRDELQIEVETIQSENFLNEGRTIAALGPGQSFSLQVEAEAWGSRPDDRIKLNLCVSYKSAITGQPRSDKIVFHVEDRQSLKPKLKLI